MIESKQIDGYTEKEILPDFLALFFAKLLGYAGPADSAARCTMSRDKPSMNLQAPADLDEETFLPK